MQFLSTYESFIDNLLYNDYLDNIIHSGSGIDVESSKLYLDNKISQLKDMMINDKLIKLYRLIFISDMNNININKLGTHYVKELSDLHEEMIDYLYNNANKIDNNITEYDAYIVTVKTNTDNIDYDETLLTFSLHPLEDEISIIDDTKINIISIEKFYK